MFNEKTVFLLNHTSYFRNPSGDEVALEPIVKGASPKAIFKKSMWSNLVDAVLQYCRVVFDIFSSEKPISVITFDNEEKIHTIWLEEDQNLEALWNVFTNEGPPTEEALDLRNCPSVPGLEPACSMLQMVKSSQKGSAVKDNVGRVIVLSALMKDQLGSWIPDILSCLKQPVKNVGYVPVTASEWLFIDLVPSTQDDPVSSGTLPQPVELPSSGGSPCPHRFLYHRLPTTGLELYRGLMRLVESHYDLSSTLVQDIPMKEEANASSSSAMYGVELLHEAGAHRLLERIGLADQLRIRTESTEVGEVKDASVLQRPNSGFSKTLGIKWVTPKSLDGALLRYTIGAYRVTLADVGNRASTCLAQFVLGGRSVALAHRLPMPLHSLPRNTDNLPPLSDHEALLLTCHGSVMYLHVLATVCPLSHPPLIPLYADANKLPSDFRTQTFIDQILRPSRLAPASARLHYAVAPRERAQQHLERSTRYWPLLESQTILGTNKFANPLFEHLPKEYLEPNELAACEDAVFKLASSIKHNVSLSDLRKPSGKRASAPSLPVAPTLQAEAVALALETDHFLSSYTELSAEHEEIYEHWSETLGLGRGRSKNPIISQPTTIKTSDNFASLSLSEMIDVARRIAAGQMDQVNVPNIPEALIKTVRSLTLLCDIVAAKKSGSSTEGARPTYPLKRGKTETERPNAKDALVIEPANVANFINLLQPTKRPRTGPHKLEFAGVATADSKGMCQLYRAMREKEKEKTAI
ncbi:unnamed protein product [Calicophoron daubneyi]|uniref:Protein asunder n=1 Tax=Calicophoron daubneyi TaxID=300641 RepID=A0AAV2TC19_CALDB